MCVPGARGRGVTPGRYRLVVVSVTAAVLALSLAAPRGHARAADRPVLPRGPAKPGFDVSRLHWGWHGTFEAFSVTTTRLVRDALAEGVIAVDTDVLVTDTPDGPLALLTEQMAYHHIAQGRTSGRDWLVAFCVVCNTAARFTPTVRGTPTTFDTVGVYDGMMVIEDAATGTLWNHMTGEALYGPSVGASLGPPGNVLHLTIRQLLAGAPQARIAISNRVYFAAGRRHGTLEGISLLGRAYARPDRRAGLSNVFAATLGSEDARRPRMDLGLGVWSDASRRYYPRDRIRQKGDAVIDSIDGRTLLVYLDPVTSTPAALFVNARRARMDGKIVRLDDGWTVRDGVVYDSRGQRVASDRPLQVFTRWYGFALTFPGTSIFGES